jgi:hypothetical protein
MTKEPALLTQVLLNKYLAVVNVKLVLERQQGKRLRKRRIQHTHFRRQHISHRFR